VPDEQQAPVGAHRGHLLESLSSVEAAGQRRMGAEQLALLCVPALGRQLGRLARTRLGAEQDRLEAGLHLRQRDAGRTRLPLAALGQAPLRVNASAVGLGLGVT
jgi:hypothetical protein